MAVFQMGPHTHAIPMSLYRENRIQLADRIGAATAHDSADRSFVLLQGGDNISLYDTDVDYVFRQESYFLYLFGATEPGCMGALNVAEKKAILFVPNLPSEYAVWMGPLMSLDDYKLKYEVDDVRYVHEIADFFAENAPSRLLTLSGVNTDSGLVAKPASFDRIDKYLVDQTTLFPIISELRVLKSAKEIEVLRYVAKISSDAHKRVMRTIKPGMSEYEGEAEFLHYCYGVGGCRHVAYTCICGAGSNSAILHYGHASAPNDRLLRDGDMCLFDMGASYGGYAADITCSFPANGRFSADQRTIYEAVLAARNAVHAAARDGVSWVEMHLVANRIMLAALVAAGILRGSVDEMIEAGVAAIFQPHGLGHFIGMDVHDVGGYGVDHPQRPTEPGVNRLRTARTLKAGMYITIEPGCYFIDPLLDKALADPKLAKYFVQEVLSRFRGFGGVRIEDDVLITATGCENFAIVPRTVDEIETWMAGGKK